MTPSSLRHAGTIYAFLFSSDIINNLMVATFSKYLQENYGYLGLFLIVSSWGIVALVATLLYPKNPTPGVHGKPHILPESPKTRGKEKTYQFQSAEDLESK